MKIVEALKQSKDLKRKLDDIRKKIRDHCAYQDITKPVYGTKEQQTAKIKEWLQSVDGILKEIMRLKVAIQRTNLAKEVTIEIDGKAVTKTIAA